MDKKNSLNELANQKNSVRMGGGIEKTDSQHKLGKWTARERVEALLDESSFVELEQFFERTQTTPGFESASSAGEGVVTGYGTIDSRPVYVFAQDYTVLAGSMSVAQAQKIVKIMDMAAKNGSPVIGMLDSGGARVSEGAAAMGAYATIIKKLNELSGMVPTIAVIAGPCMGAAAFLACLTDFTIAVNQISAVLLHGPQILSSTMGPDFDAEKTSGATAQNERTGIAQFWAADEAAAFAQVRRLLSFLPSNNLDDPPAVSGKDDLNRQIPELDVLETVDTINMITEIADDKDFMEVHARYAAGIIIGFIRLNGNTVGIVANRAGSSLNAGCAKKAARFITLLDAYHLPILTLADCGDIGVEEETRDADLIPAIAGLLFAYAQASAPMVTVVTGRAVGAGLLAMCPKSAGADIVLAWSNAVISALPLQAGALILFEDEIKSSADPATARENAIEKYTNEVTNAFSAARQGMVDDVIAPSATRQMVIAALEACGTKRLVGKPPKKHGILPL